VADLAITGATGALGGRIAERLADAGVEQRLIVRDADHAPGLDGAEVQVASSYAAEEEMRSALDGIETLMLISAREAPDRVEEHRAVIEAAADARVERIVYTSFVGAAPDAVFSYARDHSATEDAIRESGLRHTFLRDSVYLDFATLMAGPERVIRGPAGDGRLAMVSRDDVADCAAAVLLAEGAQDGETIDLTGGELLGLAELAERISAYTGRSCAYVAETVEEAWESREALGLPDWMIAGMIGSYEAIADGSLEVLSDGVEVLAGHQPQSLEDCLDANPGLLSGFE
jgi:NAD(P)H dehydrogenase (quinone)